MPGGHPMILAAAAVIGIAVALGTVIYQSFQQNQPHHGPRRQVRYREDTTRSDTQGCPLCSGPLNSDTLKFCVDCDLLLHEECLIRRNLRIRNEMYRCPRCSKAI